MWVCAYVKTASQTSFIMELPEVGTTRTALLNWKKWTRQLLGKKKHGLIKIHPCFERAELCLPRINTIHCFFLGPILGHKLAPVRIQVRDIGRSEVHR